MPEVVEGWILDAIVKHGYQCLTREVIMKETGLDRISVDLVIDALVKEEKIDKVV